MGRGGEELDTEVHRYSYYRHHGESVYFPIGSEKILSRYCLLCVMGGGGGGAGGGGNFGKL